MVNCEEKNAALFTKSRCRELKIFIQMLENFIPFKIQNFNDFRIGIIEIIHIVE